MLPGHMAVSPAKAGKTRQCCVLGEEVRAPGGGHLAGRDQVSRIPYGLQVTTQRRSLLGGCVNVWLAAAFTPPRSPFLSSAPDVCKEPYVLQE